LLADGSQQRYDAFKENVKDRKSHPIAHLAAEMARAILPPK
jgi:hypothetical protein